SYPFFLFFFVMFPRPPISTLSLHDALPICESARELVCIRIRASSRRRAHDRDFVAGRERAGVVRQIVPVCRAHSASGMKWGGTRDRKSTRLNSSHLVISYAVFCLKKKNNIK